MLSATISVQPLSVQVLARVRVDVGGTISPWSNITIAKTTDVICPEATTAPPATTLLTPTLTPEPSSTPDPSAPPTTPPVPTYTPPVLPPAACPLPGFLPPSCSECLTPPDTLKYWCVPDGVGGYVWSAFGATEVPPSGSLAVGATTAAGFQLDCACYPIFKTCPAPCTDDPNLCVCSPQLGQCIADAVCNLTPNNTAECDLECPIGSNGLECAGHGVCDCGVCRCAAAAAGLTLTSAAGSAALYTGVACEELPKQGCDYSNCLECALDSACSWCSSEGGRCQAAGSCPGAVLSCANDSSTPTSQIPPACVDDCGEHGKCVNDSGVQQCVCDKGYHGPDCSASGGLKNRAAIISGAVVAGIVLGSLAGAAVLAYGGKKGVDWMNANSGDGQRQVVNNPAFQESGKSVDNAAFDKV